MLAIPPVRPCRPRLFPHLLDLQQRLLTTFLDNFLKGGIVQGRRGSLEEVLVVLAPE
jgi:hypothetical protein